MNKKIGIIAALILGTNLFANDLDLIAKHTLKNKKAIEKIELQIEELNKKINQLNGIGSVIVKEPVVKEEVIYENGRNLISYSKEPKFVKITAHHLNVREHPSVYSEIVGYVNKDEVYEVKKIGTTETNWYFIGSGFIIKNYAEEVK